MGRIPRFEDGHRIADLGFDMKRLQPSLDALDFQGAEGMPHEIREIEMAMEIGSDGGETVPDMPFAIRHELPQIDDCFPNNIRRHSGRIAAMM
jgi:hypothetical protein